MGIVIFTGPFLTAAKRQATTTQNLDVTGKYATDVQLRLITWSDYQMSRNDVRRAQKSFRNEKIIW